MRRHLRRFSRFTGDQSGDIVSGWLLRLVVFMAVLAFIGYEVIVIGLNYVSAEDAAQEVARTARTAYIRSQDDDTAEDAALDEAGFREVDLVRFEVTDEHIIVDVTRTADTLVAHDIGFLEGMTVRTGTSRIRWRE